MDLLNHPLHLLILLAALALFPLIAVIGTCFLKLAIIFSLLRNAIGIQQVPPNLALYGLALILSAFIMAPVGFAIEDNLKANNLELTDISSLDQADTILLKPYKKFLAKHAKPEELRFFTEIGRKSWPPEYQSYLSADSLMVLVPAFTIGQLKDAFMAGLILYLPFVAIDLIVSNILLALGMMMMSPLTISLPFKLLIFILVDGWGKLIRQLVLSYS